MCANYTVTRRILYTGAIGSWKGLEDWNWKIGTSNDERYWKVGRPNTSSVIYIVQSKIYHVIIEEHWKIETSNPFQLPNILYDSPKK
jgi:hypothetical protein